MVQHLISQRQDSLIDFVQTELKLERNYILWLLDFGAVFVNKVRQFQDTQIKVEDYVRVHPQPRRYKLPEINWQDRILFEDENFIFINKPSGLPTHATVDNFQENVAFQLEKSLGKPIFVTHRLDVATQGVLTLAKNKMAVTDFNNALMKRNVKKQYAAIVEGHCEHSGEIVHYMKNDYYQPKQLQDQPEPGWQECRLKILSAEKFLENDQPRTKCRILLLTGRTHQIRCQMSRIGHPVVGDRLYGSQHPWQEHEEVSLISSSVQFVTDRDYLVEI